MGIKNIVRKVGQKAGDTVSKLSTLSPDQIEKVDLQRQAYLTQTPDPTSASSQEITSRLLGAGAVEIYNAYLKQIKQLYVPIVSSIEYENNFNAKHNIRFINITKWVTDKKENHLEKLVNVYEVLSNEECNIALVFNRTKTNTDVYLAITNTMNADNNVDVDNFIQRIKEAIKGNFPGSEWKKGDGIGVLPCLDNKIPYSVACASNIPAEKSEKFSSQTIEKLIDGIIPQNSSQEYILILLATPVQDIEERKLHLSELYTALSPYSQWQTNYTFNEMQAFGSSATVGVNLGTSVGSQRGQNLSEGINESTSDSQTNSTNQSTSHTEGTGQSHTDGSTTGGSVTLGASTSVSENAGVNLGVVSAGASVSNGYSISGTVSHSRNSSDTISKNVSDAVTKGTSNALTKAISKGVNKTVGTFSGMNLGGNFGANFSRSSSVTATVGKNEGITQNYTNFTIKHTLELLEQQMKRFEQSSALGMWDFGVYVLSEDLNIVNNVAHSYIALTQGEQSYLSNSAIHTWRGDVGEYSMDAREICEYIRSLRHPLFGLSPNIIEKDTSYLVYPSVVTSTTNLSGKELAYSLNFPQKSIAGLPVIECAEFGRNITTYDEVDSSDKKIDLGSIFHMNHVENVPVNLSQKSLASHTFITGSTGSGKSNTVYQILNEAMDNDLKFLVIEPAKGEYKHAFSNDDEVFVYATNPNIAPLLKINPFSFPKEIHVLEHIDRLVEIFNACWPMYAAMPAVLKNAIEKSYQDCGWDLSTSINAYHDTYYPSFKDVCKNIKVIIDSSDYDTDNKGAYKGSLLTRLNSLTNGLYGMIFVEDELSNETLFNQNVIVDLSRVGSMETKSLLMGMLVLKLQEYRMSTSTGMNEQLKHITVLEEAHNLLKRTSTEQGAESSNLLGKSVEMISNSIAEMRTYGEGFIIADQAPGLLDMATIRNTNTKIIMRLPDLSDRELVGKAANLNDDQITELAKLPLGVAAIYQNEWIQPVLCKIKRAKVSHKRFVYEKDDNQTNKNDILTRFEIAELLSKGEQVLDDAILKEKIDTLDIHSSLKVAILKWLKNPPTEPRMTKIAPIMGELFPTIRQAVKDSYNEANEPNQWTLCAQNEINRLLNSQRLEDSIRRDIIQSIVTDYVFLEKNAVSDFENWANKGGLW